MKQFQNIGTFLHLPKQSQQPSRQSGVSTSTCFPSNPTNFKFPSLGSQLSHVNCCTDWEVDFRVFIWIQELIVRKRRARPAPQSHTQQGSRFSVQSCYSFPRPATQEPAPHWSPSSCQTCSDQWERATEEREEGLERGISWWWRREPWRAPGPGWREGQPLSTSISGRGGIFCCFGLILDGGKCGSGVTLSNQAL